MRIDVRHVIEIAVGTIIIFTSYIFLILLPEKANPTKKVNNVLQSEFTEIKTTKPKKSIHMTPYKQAENNITNIAIRKTEKKANLINKISERESKRQEESLNLTNLTDLSPEDKFILRVLEELK